MIFILEITIFEVIFYVELVCNIKFGQAKKAEIKFC